MTISDLKEFISFHSNSSSQLNMYLRTFNLIVERISENIADISEKEYY